MRVEGGCVVRDVTVSCGDGAHAERVVSAVRAVDNVKVASVWTIADALGLAPDALVDVEGRN